MDVRPGFAVIVAFAFAPQGPVDVIVAIMEDRSNGIMKFYPTELADAYLIHLEPARDNRGFFARTFCVEEFAAHSLETRFPQHSLSSSSRRGTLRGMHFQRSPYEEVKLVRCSRGGIWDVIVDIRPSSPTYGRWQGFELSSANGHQLYIPKGFAHGFQCLTDDVEVNYLISEPYRANAASGFRHDDPKFEITWPLSVSVISEKDLHWADFEDPVQ
jgi:dTDP-4-dehydrorhamnose 3,5-epimerase